MRCYFYPRSPCGERLGLDVTIIGRTWISIHALLAESDNVKDATARSNAQFLSTLSLRRATSKNAAIGKPTLISIHALLAESDYLTVTGNRWFSIISIHALLAESDNNVLPAYAACGISIHALLAESDPKTP